MVDTRILFISFSKAFTRGLLQPSDGGAARSHLSLRMEIASTWNPNIIVLGNRGHQLAGEKFLLLVQVKWILFYSP